jgi:probable rRNA maturation factor
MIPVNRGHDIHVQRRVPAENVPSSAQLRSWALAALGDHSTIELTIRIVEEAESAELNGRFRHKPYPTNVLSFPYDAEALDVPVLGDIVVCAPVVAREATEQHKDPTAHWAHLVIHGTLHLMGYDHENDADAEKMEAQEREVLARLGFPDPY